MGGLEGRVTKDQPKDTAEISQAYSQWEGWGMVTWENVSEKEMTGVLTDQCKPCGNCSSCFKLECYSVIGMCDLSKSNL